MQRLFSMFPVGLPGVGLLCLRLTAALSLCLATQSTRIRFPALAWLLEILCFLLIIGLATPVLASCCVVAGAYALISTDGAAWRCAGIAIPVAIALALLGPGGYSVDARMFGRRSVVLNDPNAPPERRDRT
ncbi:hypothetical protein [Dyella sp. Tek66A03]|uniref:hypothetical protein n=1 Tax=Dyella sp. Tek66A03 TaxID=3458298 RepID=UPI00403EE81A